MAGALWARSSTAAPNDRAAVFRVKRWQVDMAWASEDGVEERAKFPHHGDKGQPCRPATNGELVIEGPEWRASPASVLRESRHTRQSVQGGARSVAAGSDHRGNRPTKSLFVACGWPRCLLCIVIPMVARPGHLATQLLGTAHNQAFAEPLALGLNKLRSLKFIPFDKCTTIGTHIPGDGKPTVWNGE